LNFANCNKPKNTKLRLVRCYQKEGRGIGSRRQNAEAFNNKRARELVEKLKPSADVFLSLSPLDRDGLGCRGGYMPARVVEFEAQPPDCRKDVRK
jgi:hypothetical protein